MKIVIVHHLNDAQHYLFICATSLIVRLADNGDFCKG